MTEALNLAATTDNLPALPPAARAAMALKSTQTESDLRVLVASSADIVAVVDDNGRDQAHRIAMTLRTARTTIEKAGKAARDDATKFSKAVITEQDRLIAIITPEEARVLALRDAWDAEQERIQAEKIAAERRRTEAHEDRLAAIARTPASMIGKPAADVLAKISELEQTVVGGEWEEFVDRAVSAYNDAVEQMQDIYRDKLAAEEAAAAEAAARETERQRIAAEQAEIARVRAEQEAAARVLAEQRAALEREQAEARRREQEAEAERQWQAAEAEVERQRRADEAAAELRRQQEALAAERAEFERQRLAVKAAEELARDHEEGLAMNAVWQPPARAEPDPVADHKEAEAIYETAIAAAEAPAALLDLPESEPTDEEIVNLYLENFGGTPENAIDRLLRFGKEDA